MTSSGGSGLAVVLVSGVLVSWIASSFRPGGVLDGVRWFPVVPGPGVLRVGGGGF